jgi:HSP20 family molecular chaperone IbpA
MTLHTKNNMSYKSHIFRLMEDIHPSIADATAQILRDVCKDFTHTVDKDFNKDLLSGLKSVLQKPIVNPPYMNTENTRASIHDFDDRSEIYIDVPGVKKEHISMDIDENLINVAAERHMPGGSVIKYEHKYLISHFGPNVDVDKISATHENGVLCVKVPIKVKQKKSVKRKIPIA